MIIIYINVCIIFTIKSCLYVVFNLNGIMSIMYCAVVVFINCNKTRSVLNVDITRVDYIPIDSKHSDVLCFLFSCHVHNKIRGITMLFLISENEI